MLSRVDDTQEYRGPVFEDLTEHSPLLGKRGQRRFRFVFAVRDTKFREKQAFVKSPLNALKILTRARFKPFKLFFPLIDTGDFVTMSRKRIMNFQDVSSNRYSSVEMPRLCICVMYVRVGIKKRARKRKIQFLGFFSTL